MVNLRLMLESCLGYGCVNGVIYLGLLGLGQRQLGIVLSKKSKMRGCVCVCVCGCVCVCVPCTITGETFGPGRKRSFE